LLSTGAAALALVRLHFRTSTDEETWHTSAALVHALQFRTSIEETFAHSHSAVFHY
jgi:hypothetical protein